jgi:hypothetical protein
MAVAQDLRARALHVHSIRSRTHTHTHTRYCSHAVQVFRRLLPAARPQRVARAPALPGRQLLPVRRDCVHGRRLLPLLRAPLLRQVCLVLLPLSLCVCTDGSVCADGERERRGRRMLAWGALRTPLPSPSLPFSLLIRTQLREGARRQVPRRVPQAGAPSL